MRREEYAAIEVDGVLIDAWTSYRFASDLFTPADSFHLGIGIGTSNSRDNQKNIAKLKAMLAKGKEVKLWIGSEGKRALQGLCVIEGCEIGNDADSGTALTVEGRDRATYLIEHAAEPSLYEVNDTLVSAARRAIAQWSMDVTADHVAGRNLRQARVRQDRLRKLRGKARSLGIPPSMMSEKIAASIDRGTIDFEEFAEASGADMSAARAGRLGIPNSGALPGLSSLQIYQLRVKDVRPQSGETVWEYLDRHAQRNGLLMSVDPQGRLVFSGLEYNQQPSYQLVRRMSGATHENNILSGGDRSDITNAYRRVDVYGRAKGNDATRSPFKGSATDTAADAVPFPKLLQVHDNSIKTLADAQTRAEYELGRSKQGSYAISYTVRGHSANGLVYATNTIAHVRDEVTGVNAPMYVVSRTFQRSQGAGPTTELRMVPPGSIRLKEAA